MKKLMYVKALTKKQFSAKERIEELEKKIRKAKDVSELKGLILQARKIWNWNFQMEELMNPDPNWVPRHEELYTQRRRELGIVEETESSAVTVNITVEQKATAVFKFKNITFRWV